MSKNIFGDHEFQVVLFPPSEIAEKLFEEVKEVMRAAGYIGELEEHVADPNAVDDISTHVESFAIGAYSYSVQLKYGECVPQNGECQYADGYGEDSALFVKLCQLIGTSGILTSKTHRLDPTYYDEVGFSKEAVGFNHRR